MPDPAAPRGPARGPRLGFLVALLMLEGCGLRPPAPPPPRTSSAPIRAAAVPANPPRFVDITASAGIRFRHQSAMTPRKYMIETLGSGCAFIDYDADGWQDLLLLNNAPLTGGQVTGTPRRALYRNNRDGTFSDVTEAAGLARDPAYAMGVAVGDYDNDGRPDFYESAVLGPGHLFHNEGAPSRPRFRDVAAHAGVQNRGHWGTSCAWLDYDRDGRLDLFVCNYVKYRTLDDDQPCFAAGQKRMYCAPNAYETSHCALYHNEGGSPLGPHFRDVSAASGIGRAPSKALGVAVWDYDADGFPDLFVVNDTVASFLFHNEGDGTFTDIGAESGIAYDENGNPHSGMGIDAGDLLNNGETWVAITNFQHQETSLYRQVAPGAFRDVRAASGLGEATGRVLGFGLMFLDCDEDGFNDIFQVNGHVQDEIQEREPQVTYAQPTLLFHNLGDGRFHEEGLRSGQPFSRPIVGRGCAWGDIDNDGRLSVLIASNNGPALLWRNETPTRGHWIGFQLTGARSNRDGIGALVSVTAGGATRRAMVRSGSSYLSQSDLRPRFGLGDSVAADVEVRWPSGIVDRIAGLSCDRIHALREGVSQPAEAGRERSGNPSRVRSGRPGNGIGGRPHRGDVAG